jgi:hypothetical protein
MSGAVELQSAADAADGGSRDRAIALAPGKELDSMADEPDPYGSAAPSPTRWRKDAAQRPHDAIDGDGAGPPVSGDCRAGRVCNGCTPSRSLDSHG